MNQKSRADDKLFSRRLGRVVISYNPPELICVQGVVTGDPCGHLMADVS